MKNCPICNCSDIEMDSIREGNWQTSWIHCTECQQEVSITTRPGDIWKILTDIWNSL